MGAKYGDVVKRIKGRQEISPHLHSKEGCSSGLAKSGVVTTPDIRFLRKLISSPP